MELDDVWVAQTLHDRDLTLGVGPQSRCRQLLFVDYLDCHALPCTDVPRVVHFGERAAPEKLSHLVLPEQRVLRFCDSVVIVIVVVVLFDLWHLTRSRDRTPLFDQNKAALFWVWVWLPTIELQRLLEATVRFKERFYCNCVMVFGEEDDDEGFEKEYTESIYAL